MNFGEEYAIKPPDNLSVDELNLCTLIHDYPGYNKYQLFPIAHENFDWDREKFSYIYESLINKQAIITGEQ